MQPVPLPPEACNPAATACDENSPRQRHKGIDAARAALESARKEPPGDEAKAKIFAAQKVLAAAEIQIPLIKARMDADRAKVLNPPPGNALELARQAAKLEKQEVVAKAEADLAKAELLVLQARDDGKAAAEKNRVAKETALAKARLALENPGETYFSMRRRQRRAKTIWRRKPVAIAHFPRPAPAGEPLAAWLTDQRHPLTARVAANHIWGRHFWPAAGRHGVRFWPQRRAPSHPELLDFLACELKDNNWSMKHLHRLLVTSSLYRASSSNLQAAGNLAKDPTIGISGA